MNHSFLHPDAPSADFNCLFDDRQDCVRTPEHIDQVNSSLFWYLKQGRMRDFSEDCTTIGIDRYDPIAVFLKIGCHVVARSGWIARKAHHCDGLSFAQQSD